MRTAMLIFLVLAAALVAWTAAAAETGYYVGSEICADCHPDVYDSYKKYSKKATSSESVKIMAEDLTEEEIKECYNCHTTGYGKPGGFTGFQETPEMADLGCETCHGPGSEHVDMGGDPTLIKRDLDIKDCESCHNKERVEAFNFKPLLFGGAH